MLTQLRLRHFKCFESLSLPLAPLTLLTGLNASGKSSVVQALVLLSQTMCEREWSSHLLLNGSSINLGTVADVVDQLSGRYGIEIGVELPDLELNWSFSGDRPDMSMKVESVALDRRLRVSEGPFRRLIPIDEPQEVHALTEPIRDLTYITAERLGPREVYPLQDQHQVKIGTAGEFTASVLYHRAEQVITDSLVLPNIPPTLMHQVERRMQDFFPGSGLVTDRVSNTNSVVLGLRTSQETEFFRPINVGFGLTQVLPIIVAGLAFPPGSILAVENPEVHLHPAGQAKMGSFLAHIASSGVQVLIETHSDHIMSGVRRAVRSNVIEARNVGVHFFGPRNTEQSQVISPQMDAIGNFDHWPESFFDQFDRDASFFAGWGD